MPEVSSSETPSSAAEDFGPYFFAWCDEGDAFDAALHTRFDDDIFEYNLEHQEGEFASLSITIKNPRIGLLAPGRQIWAWFSWWDGTQAVPLFKGRLVGLPENLADEVVMLNFTARPSNFASQKAALAAALRVRPYWDGIWFNDSTRDDPDNVLEFRPQAWHIDRVTHEVTVSNIINGEDGTVTFDEDEIFYDSVHVTYSQNPLRNVQMTATVSWAQAGSGKVTPSRGVGLQTGSQLQSYTGEGLAGAWPKTGDGIGGGWTWTKASAAIQGAVDSALVGEIVYPNGPNIVPGSGGPTWYADGGFDTSFGTWGKAANGTNIGWAYHVAIPNITITWTLEAGWEANRQKSEVLSFVLKADVQDIVTLPDDGEVLALSMSSSELTNAAVDETGSSDDGVTPIRSPLARGYFNSDRGAQSIESLIAIARANLLARARCVRVEYEIAFRLAIASNITLRKNSVISDPRLPGHDVGGKIVAYVFGLRNGTERAAITLACTIGKNGTHDQIAGTPDYVDDGYVDDGYQTRSGAYALPFDEADVNYEDQQHVPPNDDGVDFMRLTGSAVLIHIVNGNGPTETQEDALSRFIVTVNATGQITAVNTRFAQLSVTVPDLTGGPFQTDYPVNVSDLKIPRTIDLEATSEGASS